MPRDPPKAGPPAQASHLVCVQFYGFNLTLLAGWLTAFLLTFLNRRAAAPLVILLLARYVALMGSLTLLAGPPTP